MESKWSQHGVRHVESKGEELESTGVENESNGVKIESKWSQNGIKMESYRMLPQKI